MSVEPPVHTRALIIGSGFSGLGHGHRTAATRRRLRDPGEGRRHRRHLARQHLSRLRLRHPVAHVLVLVRTEGRLDPHVVVPAGDPGLPARGSPTSTGCVATSTSARTSTAPTGTTTRCAGTCSPRTASEYVAQFLISGAGGLHIPLIPEIRGSRRLPRGGRGCFHSAQWDHDVDIAGKRVAVIGTGASAIQIVPEIVEDVGVTAALPAHPGLGDAAAEQPDPARACAGSSPTCPAPGRRCAPPSTGCTNRSGSR